VTRIVIAEDSQEIRWLVENSLKAANYELTSTSDGAKAWESIQRVIPDIVILDVNMPVMTGIDVCKRLRQTEATRHIGVLFLTANDALAAKTLAFEAGADDLMVKPFAPRELRARIEAVLKRTEAAREAARGAAQSPARLPAPTGRVIGVAGSRGGVGTSVLTVNLATSLALEGLPTCLVDLDLERAIDTMLLDLPQTRQGTLADLSMTYHADTDWEFVSGHLRAHTSGLKVLPGPTEPTQAELVVGAYVAAYLDMVRQHHRVVMIDMAGGYADLTHRMLDLCDHLYIVASPDRPSLRGLERLVGMVRDQQGRRLSMSVIVNQRAPTPSLSPHFLCASVELPLAATIPYGGEEFMDAYNLGTPLVQKRPKHPVSLALLKLAHAIRVHV